MLVFFIVFPIGIFTLLIAVARIFKAGDYELIADAIDAALS